MKDVQAVSSSVWIMAAVKALRSGMYHSTTNTVHKILVRRLTSHEVKPLKLSKAIIVPKMTRYEYEKFHNNDTDEDGLKQTLLARGSDYYRLKQRYERHREIMNHVQNRLSERGVHTRIVTRAEYSASSIKDADVVFSAGGDGTYLLAASQIKNPNLPLIGVNTDPERSEGYLCLPRKYSFNFGQALDRLLAGDFKWVYRKRIRITMSGKHANDQPVQLLEQQLIHPEHRFSEHVKELEMHHKRSVVASDQPDRVLPIVALNDVFIGESLSARVSYYELSIDDSPASKQKSSGITVCTGTGSSSWHFNINHLQKQDVREILRIAQEKMTLPIPYDDRELVKSIYSEYNRSLFFDAALPKLAFTVRDPVQGGLYQVADPRGFAKKLTIRSRMWDACLVIDGGVSFQFNDGAEATLQTCDDDDLKTVFLD